MGPCRFERDDQADRVVKASGGQLIRNRGPTYRSLRLRLAGSNTVRVIPPSAPGRRHCRRGVPVRFSRARCRRTLPYSKQPAFDLFGGSENGLYAEEMTRDFHARIVLALAR